MADSPSTKPASTSNRPTLLPQGGHSGKPAMPLGAHQFTLIGSRNRAHLHLLSSSVSRNHACIITGKANVYVRDLASRSGVIVNSRKVRESELHDGDLVQFGSFKFKFQEPAGPIRLATAPPPPLAMLQIDGGALTPMDERTVLIGRRAGCDITLDSPAVSNTHAVIFEYDGRRVVRDLGSRTGTHVNGKAVNQQVLEIGDKVRIGDTTLRYVAADMPALEPEKVAESLPLEAEADDQPAVADQTPRPTEMHFEPREAPLEAEAEAPLAQPEDDSIPLLETAGEAGQQAAPSQPAAASPPIEFATKHPIEEHAPIALPEVPVEEEMLLAEQDLTAPAAAIPEPAEDLEDWWKTDSDETVTADASATPDLAAVQETPGAIDFASAPEEISTASAELAHADTEGPHVVAEHDLMPTVNETAIAPEDQVSDELLLEPGSIVPTSEEPPAPEAGVFEAEDFAIRDIPSEARNEELHPVPVEPEASSLEETAPQVEPELAEEPDRMPPEVASPETVSKALQTEPVMPEAVLEELEAPTRHTELSSEMSHVTELTPAAPLTEDVNASAIEPAELIEAEPLGVEKPDRAPVQIETEIEALERAADSLSDVLPNTTEQDTAQPSSDSESEPAEAASPATDGKRAGRGARKRAPRTSRRKKAMLADEVVSESSEQSSPLAPDQASAADGLVTDLTPALGAAGFIASEPAPEAEYPKDAAASAEVTPAIESAARVEFTASVEAETPVEEMPAHEESTPLQEIAPGQESAPLGLTSPLDMESPGEVTTPAPVPPTTGATFPAEASVEPAASLEMVPPGDATTLSVPDAGVAEDLPPEVLPPVETEANAEVGWTSIEPQETSAAALSQSLAPEPLASLASEARLIPPEAPEELIDIGEQGNQPQLTQWNPPPGSSEKPSEFESAEPLPGVLQAEEHDAPSPEYLEVAESERVAPAEATPPISFVEPPSEKAIAGRGSETETVENTQPDLESALSWDPSIQSDHAEQAPVEETSPLEPSLSDSAFGAIVTDFAGEESGPLVERQEAIASPTSATLPIATTTSPSAASEDQPIEASQKSQQLSPLGGVDLPPLELGEALTFGTDEAAKSAESPAVAGDVALEQPIDADLTSSGADLQFTAPEMSEPTLDLEAASDFSAALEAPSLEMPSFDAGLEWEEPAATSTVADEIGLEFEETPAAVHTSLGSSAPQEPAVADASTEMGGQTDTYPAPTLGGSVVAPALEAGPPPGPKQPPMNPFFGMERDQGSFIGGMPLPLAVPPPQVLLSGTHAAQPSALRPAPIDAERASSGAPPARTPVDTGSLKFQDDPKAELDLDKLFEGEEPLELFDETADQLDQLPDSLEPLADLDAALGQTLDRDPSRSVQADRTAPAAAAPMRSLTADPTSATPFPTRTSVTIPPFAGSRPAHGPAGNPFSGVTGVRPTDVFSQTAFPPMEAPHFRAQPIDSRPTGAGKAESFDSPPGFGSPTPPRKSDADAAAASARPRPVAPRPSAEMMTAELEHRRPWWKNVRVLLPLLVLLIIAAVVVIIRFLPAKTLVQGTLQIKGIDDRDTSVFARREQVNHVRDALKRPELREAVLQRLAADNVTPGFVQSPEALAALADPANSSFESGRLVLQRPQTDPQDQQRMWAILQAIYFGNKTAAEQTTQVRSQATVAGDNARHLAEQVNAQQGELKKMSDEVKAAGGASASDLLLDPAVAVNTLLQQNVELHKALDAANAEVKQKHEDWEHAQAAAHDGGGNADAKVFQIRQKLASLNAQLAVARVSSGALTDPARAFDDAVQTVGQELTLIASATSKDSALSNYLSTARRATAEIHSLLDVQKQDADHVAELRKQLAEHREAHLRQVWSADETLKGLLDERDAQAHRLGTASDSGYAQDAARIRGVMDELDQKIEARRQSLATTGQSSDQLQQSLEQTIERLQSDRRDKDARIASALARLDIPAVGKLQRNDEQLLDRVGQDVAAAKAAREQYVGGPKPAATDGQAEVSALEASVAEQQAQLDAYEQRPDAQTAVVTARKALDAAQDAEAKAQAAFATNLNLLTSARQYKDVQLRISDLTTAKDAADRDAQSKATEAGTVPILLPPDQQNAVQAIQQPDQRVWYLAGAIGLILIVFAGPLWIAARESRSDLPYADVAPSASLDKHERRDEAMQMLDDDEHPALT